MTAEACACALDMCYWVKQCKDTKAVEDFDYSLKSHLPVATVRQLAVGRSLVSVGSCQLFPPSLLRHGHHVTPIQYMGLITAHQSHGHGSANLCSHAC